MLKIKEQLDFDYIEKYFSDNRLNLHVYFCLERNIYNLGLFLLDFPVKDYPQFYFKECYNELEWVFIIGRVS